MIVGFAKIAAPLLILALAGCEEEKVVVKEKHTYKGDIKVLNSCGIQGAALEMRKFLRKNGFDVVYVENDQLQNYEETLVVLRNPKWEGGSALAEKLHTKNVLTIINKNSYEDAAVFIGKDYKNLIEQENEQ